MSERRIFVCDVCGAEQAATNHWFAAIITDRGKSLRGPSGDDAITIARLGSLDPDKPADRLFHLCGETCALKKVSEFLGAK